MEIEYSAIVIQLITILLSGGGVGVFVNHKANKRIAASEAQLRESEAKLKDIEANRNSFSNFEATVASLSLMVSNSAAERLEDKKACDALIAELRSTMAKQQEVLKDQQERIVHLEAALAKKEKHVKELEADYRANIQAMSDELTQANTKIHLLQEELEQYKDCKECKMQCKK